MLLEFDDRSALVAKGHCLVSNNNAVVVNIMAAASQDCYCCDIRLIVMAKGYYTVVVAW